ncbi:Uncharacterised protein [Vibrio cholerae]|nr:Uncharacterised protein [Vibrio cholerae]
MPIRLSFPLSRADNISGYCAQSHQTLGYLTDHNSLRDA